MQGCMQPKTEECGCQSSLLPHTKCLLSCGNMRALWTRSSKDVWSQDIRYFNALSRHYPAICPNGTRVNGEYEQGSAACTTAMCDAHALLLSHDVPFFSRCNGLNEARHFAADLGLTRKTARTLVLEPWLCLMGKLSASMVCA